MFVSVFRRSAAGKVFGFAALAVLPTIAGVTLLARRANDRVTAQLEIERQTIRTRDLADRAMRMLLVQDDAMKAILLEPDRLSDEAARKIGAFDAKQAAMDSMFVESRSAKLRSLVDSLRLLDSTRIAAIDTEILEEVLGGEREAAIVKHRAVYLPAREMYGSIVGRIEALADRERLVATSGARDAQQSARSLLWLQTALLLATLAVAGVAAGAWLTRRLRALESELARIGTGDLRDPADDGSLDEISRIRATLTGVVSGMRHALHAETVDWESVGHERVERARQEALAREAAERERSLMTHTRNEVDRLLVALIAVRDGDLRGRIESEGTDALAQLARGLDELVSSMRQSLTQMSEHATQIDESATELSRLADGVHGRSSETCQRVTVTAEEARSAADLLEEVSGSTAELASSVDAIARSAREASTIAEHAVPHAESARTTVDALTRSGEEIRSVVKMISDVAFKLKILSFNASIEAARAGDAGLGFAVVAAEVTALARTVSESAEWIGERVETIRGGALSTSNAIAEITEFIDRIVVIQGGIATSVDAHNETTSQIAAQVSGVVATNERIASAMAAVAEAAYSDTETSQHLRSAARGLTEVAEQMSDAVRKYTLGDDASAESEYDEALVG
jgi:methyl-accepting chemotaxis protein